MPDAYFMLRFISAYNRTSTLNVSVLSLLQDNENQLVQMRAQSYCLYPAVIFSAANIILGYIKISFTFEFP